ncbi:MAG: ASCH domain-containing protein [Mycobacteriales bacterium]|nr:ASCH domain-containing protein [Mycobacteriales bacterium]
MADTATGRVALFSIKPEYATAILDGSKEVEFRRTSLASDVSHVVIYATSPVQRVVGTFEVAGVESALPAALWTTYGRVGGIGLENYEDYFTGTDSAYAIKVRRPRSWAQPLTLDELSPGLRAPQSYQYLRDDALARIGPLLEPDPRRTLPERLGRGLLARVRAALPALASEPREDGDPVPCR